MIKTWSRFQCNIELELFYISTCSKLKTQAAKYNFVSVIKNIYHRTLAIETSVNGSVIMLIEK